MFYIVEGWNEFHSALLAFVFILMQIFTIPQTSCNLFVINISLGIKLCVHFPISLSMSLNYGNNW